MDLKHVSAGKKIPDDVNVIIEIAAGSDPIKYEIDKESGMVMVDRFIGTSMHYPCDYGFIPQTLSEDGDPVDVLVISPCPLMPGIVICCRPVGLLRMTDESGKDAKILAVPVDKLTTRYEHVQNPHDLESEKLASIKHFFEHYKDLEQGKWVKVEGWEGVSSAREEIQQGVERFKLEQRKKEITVPFKGKEKG